MPEHAIAIARVSTLKQHEEDQRPGLMSYADRRGYTLDQIVPVKGKSAFHGKHVKDILNAVDAYVQHGQATVVIFRHVDRSSREGVFKGIDLLNKIMAAGARIEFSEQEFLNDNPGLIGLFMELALNESKIKQDRKLQGNITKRASGQMVGFTPWGYDSVFGTSVKTGREVRINIKPNAIGRKWIPAIFDAAINGKSREAIAEMLRGVPSPRKNSLWDPSTVARIIANTTYYGVMKGNPNMGFESLVTVEIYKQANAAIASRRRNGRSTTKREAAFAKPVCGNCFDTKREGAPSGRSPMYRMPKVSKWGEWNYYACRGHGAARKSCGAPCIPAADLDALIDATMAADDRPRVVRVPVAGDDNNEQRDIIGQKIAAAVAAGDFALIGELSQQAMSIGPSKTVSRIEDRDSGKTVGQHWQTLTHAEKREELANWTILARLRDGNVECRLTWRSPWQTDSAGR
jgi:DNA invertase Pin-like site-specific DNA recombinase